MPRVAPHRLTARTVASLKDGVFGDGGNLWLTVKGNVRAWSVRYKSPVTGKAREMGIGSARDISLVEARRRATVARQFVMDGIDPLDRRAEEKAARRRETGLTFDEVADRFITERTPGWNDPRAAEIWRSSLLQHASARIGKKVVTTIDTDDVLAILRPIWTTKTETAGRIRGRIERILDYARTHGWRDGENPARWRGHLDNILPAPSKVAKVTHHAAVDRQDIGRVMAALAASDGLAAKAVRFLCLTAARSGEVRSLTWSEIDLHARVWAVPAERMKAGRDHRVPLSDVALSKALHQAAGTKDVTVHGLRSTFRDWAAEETDYPREVAEMALAHAIGDKVEAAYRRGDLFAKRREMMEFWEGWCSAAPT